MSNDLRFDLEARVEVWVDAKDIRENPEFAAAILESDPAKRLQAIKEIAVKCAELRLAENPLEITAYPALSDVNIDRINWQELATESHV